jgi:putative ABC transport system permease protein
MSHNIPGGEVNNTYISFEMPDGMHARLINSMFVDHDFLKVMRLKLLEGSDFDSSMKNKLDTNAFIIINESAKKLLGYKQAVGKKVHTGYHYGFRQGEIIGVVKDFHVASLHRPIEPLVLALGTLGRPEGKKKFLTIKVRAADLPNTIDFIRRTYARFGQGYPFQYNFLDQEFNDQYRKEEKQKILFTCFAILSILCSFLGLVGLVSFVVKHRAKEIAIRRISGASTADIVATLSKDFLRLMLLAWIVAAPVAYLVMHNWLQMFAYHVSLQFSVFGLAGLATLLLVAATVALQIVIAAQKSPAAVLRHD